MAFKILIVDDDQTKIDEVRHELQNANLENLEITVSQNRRDALELLKQKQYELIIVGVELSSIKTQHIDIRYFFMNDQVKSINILIEHGNTLEMLEDNFTKLLQVTLE